MKNWLHPRAFWVWALLMLVLRLTRIPSSGVDSEWIGVTLVQVVMGGVFWGVVSTYLYNRFYKR